MLLVTGSFHELAIFIQIICWIMLPVLTTIILLTSFFHFRKKRKNKRIEDDAETDFVLASPEQFNHKKEDGEYVFFDHSGLIREYKKRMFYNHARFIALKRDYSILETKYYSFRNDKRISLLKNKTLSMENKYGQSGTISIPGNEDTEKEELVKKLEWVNKSHRRLEEENRFLQEQIDMQTAGDDEKEKIMARWKAEIKLLTDKVLEQEYVQELLNEKKAEIIFLQNQMEQRVKNQHKADQQRTQAVTEAEQVRQQMDLLKNELGQQQDRAVFLENTLVEIKQQNELLNAEVRDSKDVSITLKGQLEQEQQKVKLLEQRLERNRQTLRKLYKEISSCVDTGENDSLVIELNPMYIDKETASQ